MNKERYKEGIIEAYKFLRLENSSIPSDIVDFIKDASLEKLENLKTSQNVEKSKITQEGYIKQKSD